MSALDTTAVVPSAIFPAVFETNPPVGMKVKEPPVAKIGAGGVIVTMLDVPEMNVIGAVGAIVVALAIVGAIVGLAIKPTFSFAMFAVATTRLPVSVVFDDTLRYCVLMYGMVNVSKKNVALAALAVIEPSTSSVSVT